MKQIKDLLIVSTVSAALCTGFAFAQDRDDHRAQDRHDTYTQDSEHHDNDRRDADHRDAYSQQDRHDVDRRDGDRRDEHYVKHDDWKRGYHLRHEQWESARRINDWRAYHLEEPQHGYEWRYADGYYILANDDGVIYSVVPANGAEHY